jgi:hypothetical protein
LAGEARRLFDQIPADGPANGKSLIEIACWPGLYYFNIKPTHSIKIGFYEA